MNKNAPTALRCEGITKTFDDGTGRLITVLNGAGFSVAPGEVLAIVGASGSGKSTLLHILGGLDVPDGGHVFIEDKDIGTLSDKQLGDMRNRELGFVYQFHHLLPEFTAESTVGRRASAHGHCPRYGDGPGLYPCGRTHRQPRSGHGSGSF